ncbi:MAG: hypothetical protein IH606_12835 [Burkholderiales bacterium]|nr:hypothetical protein [Burkholderiales bacterium]
MNPWHQRVVEIATGLQQSQARSPTACKAIIKRQLETEGWHTSTRFKVPSRGTNDHYRGILDLIAWPPPFPDSRGPEHKPNPHVSNRPPPVLIELDKVSVRHKTRAKLAAFNYPSSGRVVILTQADDSPPCPGVDTIVCMGA